jgi:hypothetical protein
MSLEIEALERIFDELPLPAGEEEARHYSVISVADLEEVCIGKDGLGRATLLLSSDGLPTEHYAPLRLERLEVHYNIPCVVHEPSNVRTRRFTIVRCTSAILTPYFLRVCMLIVSSFGGRLNAAAILERINRLVDLFQALTRPAQGSTQGLWAELFLVALSSDPAQLVRMWRADPADRFDFASGAQRVEVKSTTGYEREHHFSLPQLRPSSTLDVVIASLFVERSGGGRSLQDLIDEIITRVGAAAEEALCVEQIAAETLGVGYQRGVQERFDYEHAKATLCYFAASALPAVSPELPPEVSDVRFVVDCSEVPPLHLSELHSRGGMFSLLPGLDPLK